MKFAKKKFRCQIKVFYSEFSGNDSGNKSAELQ